jgi:hypothetical protein
MELAGHRQDVFVDFQKLAVRQDFPLLKRLILHRLFFWRRAPPVLSIANG